MVAQATRPRETTRLPLGREPCRVSGRGHVSAAVATVSVRPCPGLCHSQAVLCRSIVKIQLFSRSGGGRSP